MNLQIKLHLFLTFSILNKSILIIIFILFMLYSYHLLIMLNYSHLITMIDDNEQCLDGLILIIMLPILIIYDLNNFNNLLQSSLLHMYLNQVYSLPYILYQNRLNRSFIIIKIHLYIYHENDTFFGYFMIILL